MVWGLRSYTDRIYQRVLESELSTVPDHVAIIQDGNRRYARKNGQPKTDGHRAGAETTEQVLQWCNSLGITEVTIYAFSTENFERPADEREALFELISDRLRSFADDESVHNNEVRIQAIGETHRLPVDVQDAIAYAEDRTASYDSLQLNVALAYGGRSELLNIAKDIASEAASGELSPSAVDVSEIADRMETAPTQPADLIIRSGGDKRTSNFLPWHANGNEAAVYFSSPYWPEFSRTDFLRAIRTYESRETSWQYRRFDRIKLFGRATVDVTIQELNEFINRLQKSEELTQPSKPDSSRQSQHDGN